jgi:hypothetical protein
VGIAEPKINELITRRSPREARAPAGLPESDAFATRKDASEGADARLWARGKASVDRIAPTTTERVMK